MTAVDLPAIRALLAGVTPGEIEVERYAHGGGRVWVRPRPGIRFLMADTYEGTGNREFIAAAPSIVAQLLARIDAVEAVVKRLDWEIENSEAAEFNAAEANLGAQLMACQSETFAYKQVRRLLRAAITGEGA